MKLSFALVLCICEQILCYSFQTKYIEVPLDHFSFTNNATFQLKYLINNINWIDNGPIFFYAGNEGNIENFAQNSGFMFDIAPSFNALLVFAEHRYYGSTLPFGNDSFSSPSRLGYLTSNQALADYVYLINYLQNSLQPLDYDRSRIPVVAFGGSYGGMLAAWLRMKYPATVVGAIACSAPIWQFQGLTPCENFNIIVSDVYASSINNKDCSIPISKLWKAVRDLTSTKDGQAWLSNQWKMCLPLKTPEDTEILLDWLQEVLVNMAMVNYPYATSFLVPLPANPVNTFCNRLLESLNGTDGKSLLTAVGSAIEIYTNYTQKTQCNNINNTSPVLGEDTWDFQACTEMIMPMCSTDKDMFENKPWNFNTFAEECYKKWGVKPTLPELPILEYGGKDIGSASNIVFSNGLLDPWSSGGVLNNVSSSVVAVIIAEGAHHLDLRGANKRDPAAVVLARQFHIENIRRWIREFYYLRDIDFREQPIIKVTQIKQNET